MAGISFFPESTNPEPQDSIWRVTQKILGATIDGGGGGGGGNTLTGSGNPNGSVTGTAGQVYTDYDTGQIWVNVGGGTVWV